MTASGELAFYRHAQRTIFRARPADGYPPATASRRAPAAGIPGPRDPGGSEVSAPAWLAGSFAALMMMIAVCCAARLGISRLRCRNAERDTDALHVLMGVAMAWMLEPRLAPVPVTAWRAVFAAAAAWFAWQAIRPGRRVRGARCSHPAPHAVECGAMVYMLLPVGSWPSSHSPAMAMPGMSQGSTAANPVLTLVLALFMLGYVLWAVDRLASVRATPAASAREAVAMRPYPAAATVAAAVNAPGLPVSDAEPYALAQRRPALAPRLATSATIAMAGTMGYMLITML